MNSFAEKLRYLRRAAGLSQAELSRLSGVAPASLSRYEHEDPAHRRLPSRRSLAALARALGASADELETPDIRAMRPARGLSGRRAGHKGWNPGHVADTAVVLGRPKVGKGTTIGEFVVLDATHGDVTIGADCEIGHGAQVLTRAARKNGNVLTGPVKCGRKVVIGANAVILPGAELGDHEVVLPGTTRGMEALLSAPAASPPGASTPEGDDAGDPLPNRP